MALDAWMGSKKAATGSTNYNITGDSETHGVRAPCPAPPSLLKTWNSKSRNQHLFLDKTVTADKINKSKSELL